MSNSGDTREDVQHPSLYFTDGDIVLSVANTEDNTTMIFRVDKIYLCRSSTVMRNLLSIPPQPDSNELYDGVPRINMPGDSSQDVEMLLDALYNVSIPQLKKSDPDTPIKMGGLMKLAVKYDIDSVRDTILRQLKEDWPQTLQEWDYQQSIITTVRQQRLKGRALGKLDDIFPEPASAIVFALDYACPEILPPALYQLTLTNALDDRTKKTVGGASVPYGLRRTARWDMLDGKILMRVLRAKERLKWLRTDTTILQRHPKCVDGWNRTGGCSLAIAELTRRAAEDPSPGEELDYLHFLAELHDEASQSESLCPKCNGRVRRAVEARRQTFWDDLPRFFELDSLYS